MLFLPASLRVSRSVQEMIEEADLDGDNEIDQEEFLRIMKKTSLSVNKREQHVGTAWKSLCGG